VSAARSEGSAISAVVSPESPRIFDGYTPLPGTYDELIAEDGSIRPSFRAAVEALGALPASELARCQSLAERALLNQGVTFSVYSDQRGSEKIFPYCVLPRVVSASDWDTSSAGWSSACARCRSSSTTSTARERILKEGVIPEDLVLGAEDVHPPPQGHEAAIGGVRIHIAGIDLIRDRRGCFASSRTTCGRRRGCRTCVENRIISKRVFPQRRSRPLACTASITTPRASPRRCAPSRPRKSTIARPCVVLTPGPYNSAYFEHSFLARTMGIELVRARGSVRRGRRGVRAHDARAACVCT
jgi:uncharacterized circularly permuted ATP-grasp superfamily protein